MVPNSLCFEGGATVGATGMPHGHTFLDGYEAQMGPEKRPPNPRSGLNNNRTVAQPGHVSPFVLAFWLRLHRPRHGVHALTGEARALLGDPRLPNRVRALAAASDAARPTGWDERVLSRTFHS